MSDGFSEILRRSFVAVATTSYSDPSLPTLEGVADEVGVFKDWLCDERLGHRRFTHTYTELAQNPNEREIDDALKASVKTWNDGDAAVLYVSGHGLQTDDGLHWIALQTTDASKLRTTAISTSSLIGWLTDCEIDHLMVILDLCAAGAATLDTVRLPAFKRTWIGLASTAPNSLAMTGALTKAIREFLDELATKKGARFNHGPYLQADEFVGEIERRLLGQRLHFLHPAVTGAEFSPCLPNPYYVGDSQDLEPAHRDLAIRLEDLLGHWEPKARGSDAGWMFTGRVNVIKRLIGFLKEEPSVLVVTGAAGTGKSAVLGRLVVFTDRRFQADHAELIEAVPPDLQPGVGAVDVAVLATGKSSEDLFLQILGAVGAAGDEPRPTLEELTARWNSWIAAPHSSPLTVVIDALDEAKNPGTLFHEVVLPIARNSPPGSVRLIVGVRAPSSDGSFGPAPEKSRKPFPDYVVDELNAQRLDVDKEPYWRIADLAEFAVDILLNTPRSPYAANDHHDLARRVATVIADRTEPSFLVTKLAANNLAQASAVIDPEDPDWLRSLEEGLVGVFRDDLRNARPKREQRLKAIHLLRAVAFAYGRGLPWSQVWPLVATAIDVSAVTYGDSDVAELLDSRLNGYLVTDHEDGYTVYRLFHDALRTTLREHWVKLIDHEG